VIFFIATFSFALYYLDNFNLSKNLLVKQIQILSFILSIIVVFGFFHYAFISYDIINYIGDVNNNIGTHVNVTGQLSVNDEKAGSAMATSAVMVGAMGVVGKTIAKSGLPPMQKAGVILGIGVAAGIAQVGIGGLNGYLNGVSGTSNNVISNTPNVNKLVGDLQISPLYNVL
jgi:hypothetical protein